MNEQDKELFCLRNLVSAKSTHNPLASSTSFVERTKKQRHDPAQTSDGSCYKEALFLCIPLLYQICTFTVFTVKASLASDVTVAVLRVPMFNHRVLPLPPLPSPLAATSNTLLPGVNMASDSLGSTKVVGTRRLSLRSSSPKSNHYPTTSEKTSPDLGLVLHPPVSIANKRTASQDSVEEVPRTDSGYPSFSTSGILTSQVCLCQPDPKVPRPRNGKYQPVLYSASVDPLLYPDKSLSSSNLN